MEIAVPLRLTGKSPPPVRYSHPDADQNCDISPSPKPRLLIVEDEFLVAMTLENDLTEAGYEIAGVTGSADEAVELAQSTRPAFIVMDIRLAGARDGIDAALQIFSETGIRCLFATANADNHSIERAKPANPLGWLQKPYHSAALISAVRDSLAKLVRTKE
jgi:two-component system, response regulator PdtaR